MDKKIKLFKDLKILSDIMEKALDESEEHHEINLEVWKTYKSLLNCSKRLANKGIHPLSELLTTILYAIYNGPEDVEYLRNVTLNTYVREFMKNNYPETYDMAVRINEGGLNLFDDNGNRLTIDNI